MKKIMSKPGLALLVLAVVAIVVTVSSRHKSSAALMPATELPTLAVVKVAAHDIEQVVQLPGEFRPYQEVDVDAKVRGYVEKMNVDIGDVVKEGQVLAILDIPEIHDQMRQADAAVARAAQDADRARAAYEDVKAVYERLSAVMQERPGLIAQQDLDQARAKWESAHADYTGAQSAIEEAQANRQRLQSISNYSKIVAPFDGTITQRFVSNGALVGDNSGPSSVRAIFHLSEVQKLRLVIRPPESQVPDLAVGKMVTIRIDALQQTTQAPIARISHELATDTRTMHVEIDFDNPQRDVAPGMFAQVSLPLKKHSDVVAVPLGAIHNRRDDQATVYVLSSDGSAQARPVTLGLFGADYVELSKGVQLGETVAVDSVPEANGSVHYAPKYLEQLAENR